MKKTLITLALASLSLTACVTPASKSGSVYDNASSGSMQQTAFGRVVDLRKVTIDKSTGGTQALGTGVGGTIGGVAGSQVAKRGSGWNTVGAAVGAGVGAAAGDMAMRSLNKTAGYEITLRMESGSIATVVQETDTPISIGDCVKVVYGGNQARVSPSNACRN